ncbi:hypothetical protein BDR06DRAFT_110835 [Suillus hirtellus]|nr:hypothetical protein BDR06DRAFT_110835 [Suillus hirtellus]
MADIVQKPFKSSRNRIPANQNVDLRDVSTTVVQNVEMEGVSSSQKVDSSNDNKHPTTFEIIPSDSVNHRLCEELVSQVFSSYALTFLSNFGGTAGSGHCFWREGRT